MEQYSIGTLLVVEDDADVREVILDTLYSIPYQILSAENGKQAFDIITKNSITAVLSDINMPEMNGLDLLEKLRIQGYDIPFVFLSGFSDRENTLRALRGGAYDFVDKPFESETLCLIVTQAMKYGIKLQELNQKLAEASKNGQQLDSLEILKAKKEIELMKFENSRFSDKKKVA